MPGQPKHPVNLSTATRCQKSRWSPLRRSDSSGKNSLMPYIGKARISALERASCYGVFNSTQINRLKKDPYASERAQFVSKPKIPGKNGLFLPISCAAHSRDDRRLIEVALPTDYTSDSQTVDGGCRPWSWAEV